MRDGHEGLEESHDWAAIVRIQELADQLLDDLATKLTELLETTSVVEGKPIVIKSEKPQ